MKLNELELAPTAHVINRVFESYFDQKVPLGRLSTAQSRSMLSRVQQLIKEHRATKDFHFSEQDPAYLKLIMIEQVLARRLREQTAPATTDTGTAPDPRAKAMQAAEIQQWRRNINDQIKDLQDERRSIDEKIRDLQQKSSNPTLAMTESVVAQAQATLAAQSLVDNVQDMIEETTSMQFKDVPALVQQMRNQNQVSLEQATQFNNDAIAALSEIVKSLEVGKQQLETALAVVTGEQSVMPGMSAMTPTDTMAGTVPELGQPTLDQDAELPQADVKAELGRERR